MTARASYRAGVAWIADCDESAETDVDVMAEVPTVLLLAELFGKPAATVARDVVAARTRPAVTKPKRMSRMALEALLQDVYRLYANARRANVGPTEAEDAARRFAANRGANDVEATALAARAVECFMFAETVKDDR